MIMESRKSVPWEYWKSAALDSARKKLLEARRLIEQVRGSLETVLGTGHLASDVIDEALEKLWLSGSRVARAHRIYDSAMPSIQGMAIRDANRDYVKANQSDSYWLAYVARARRGERSPFDELLHAIGPFDLCRSFGVSIASDFESVLAEKRDEWRREYDGYYLSAMEVMARPPAKDPHEVDR